MLSLIIHILVSTASFSLFACQSSCFSALDSVSNSRNSRWRFDIGLDWRFRKLKLLANSLSIITNRRRRIQINFLIKLLSSSFLIFSLLQNHLLLFETTSSCPTLITILFNQSYLVEMVLMVAHNFLIL